MLFIVARASWSQSKIGFLRSPNSEPRPQKVICRRVGIRADVWAEFPPGKHIDTNVDAARLEACATKSGRRAL